MPACPETASIKNHSEVSIYSPIHTYAYRHNINENDQIKEKSKDIKENVITFDRPVVENTSNKRNDHARPVMGTIFLVIYK